MAEALPAEGASLFERWAGRLAGLSGLRRQAVAFASGLLASLALPPLHLVILLVPAFTAQGIYQFSGKKGTPGEA